MERSLLTAEVCQRPTDVPAVPAPNGVLIDCQIERLFYGEFLALRDMHVPIGKGAITAFIGPSGCGKSTALRCLNRMNDLVRGFRFEGHVLLHGQDIYGPQVDPVAVRRNIGMVFQQPDPFAMSIFKNVAFGLKLNRYKGDFAARVEGGPARLGALGRGQGQAQKRRPVAFGRPAAAALHRTGHRD
jgi:ABC-type Fe3+/spermidine/putrescine transport system ATPase subunit